MIDPEEYRKTIERKILGSIREQLKSGEIDAKKTQEIARFVLDALRPHMSLDEIHKALPLLASHFSEISHVIAPFINEREEDVKVYVSKHVNTLVQKGEIDKAKTMVTSALNNDLHIE